MTTNETTAPQPVALTMPGALVEAIRGRVDRGVYASMDEFVNEAVRERLRIIAGSYHTIHIDTLDRNADEGLDEEAGEAAPSEGDRPA